MRTISAILAALALAAVLATAGQGSPAPSAPVGVLHVTAGAPLTKLPRCLKYKKVRGKKICVKRAKPAPKPKPKPVPTPAPPTQTPTGAPDGSYTGVTAQNAAFHFAVGSSQLTGLGFDEIDLNCDAGFEDAFSMQASGSIALDGSGHAHATIPVTLNGGGGSGTLTFDITIDTTGKATGTLTQTLALTGANATNCSSGSVAFNAGTGAAAPAAPQHVAPGHYVGTTSQGAAFVFDVGASGTFRVMNNLTFPELDEDCDPGQVHIAITDFNFTGTSFLIDAMGAMKARYLANEPDFQRTFTITGSLPATGAASGTITDQAAFPSGGTNWTCVSGVVNWTANRQ